LFLFLFFFLGFICVDWCFFTHFFFFLTRTRSAIETLVRKVDGARAAVVAQAEAPHRSARTATESQITAALDACRQLNTWLESHDRIQRLVDETAKEHLRRCVVCFFCCLVWFGFKKS
jgi:hypothetical protein